MGLLFYEKETLETASKKQKEGNNSKNLDSSIPNFSKRKREAGDPQKGIKERSLRQP